jgi:hypothetical protein
MQEGPGWLYGRLDRYADHLQGGDVGAHAGRLAGSGRQAGSVVGEECRKAQDGDMADRTGMLTACRVVTQVLAQGI